MGVVRRVLPGGRHRWWWRSRPAAELDETFGAAAGTYPGIAAVTTTAGSGTGPDAPVHVFVIPE